jgi:enoyl-CoA hydratase
VPFSHILFEADCAGIAVAAVNRPEKRNALSNAVVGELAEAVELIARDPSIRGAIITGVGEKAFVAGADIAELAALTPAGAQEYSQRGQAMLRRLETMGKPVAAVLNGHALGGGLELALACTVRFACEGAKLGLPEVRLGLIPGFGGTQRLPRLVGRGRALEMMLSGEPISAQDALRIGLVNAVTPAPDLMETARAWLLKAAANAPMALRMAMDAVDAGLDGGLDEGLRLEAAAFGLCAATDDCREGVRAFLEKRRPQFAGK